MASNQRTIDLAEAIGRDMRLMQLRMDELESSPVTTPVELWPITPITLQPPEPAGELPSWALLESEPSDLSAFSPVDLRLACLDYNFFDLQLNSGMDLLTDSTLDTAVLISLFTNRYDPESEKGGWWGDGYTESPDLFGSRLWLLNNNKINTQTLRDAENYARESLQWMLNDELLTKLNIGCQFERGDNAVYRLRLAVSALYQKGSHYDNSLNREYLI